MSIELVNLQNPSHSLHANWWTWTPTLQIIEETGLLDSGRLDQMEEAAPGVQISDAEALAIAEQIENDVLHRLMPSSEKSASSNSADALVTNKNVHNYGVSTQWVQDFVTFLRSSGGFVIE